MRDAELTAVCVQDSNLRVMFWGIYVNFMPSELEGAAEVKIYIIADYFRPYGMIISVVIS